MKKQKLDALERDAKTLSDPKDREQALKVITELRAAQSDLKLRLEGAVRTTLRYPHFKNYDSSKFAKLVFGAVAFLALCASVVFLIMPLGGLLDGTAGDETIQLFTAALTGVTAFGALLYLLARRPHAERESLERDPVAKKFAKQKLQLQLSSLGLLGLAIILVVFCSSVRSGHCGIAPIALPIAVLFLYWLLGRMFWRCPACGCQLTFMNKFGPGQAVEKCPSCHATLQ